LAVENNSALNSTVNLLDISTMVLKCFLAFVILLILSVPTAALYADSNNIGFRYYQSWSNDNPSEIFWSYLGSSLNTHDIERFNMWYSKAEFKDISPKIDSAYFFRTPWPNKVIINSKGNLLFTRDSNDKDAHTMIELSVNNDPTLGDFVNYDGYRSMATGIPYEIVIDTKVTDGSWIKSVPWLLVFQGHAIPDLFDKGKRFNPPFALVISRGRWEAHVRADSRLSLPKDRSYQRYDKIDLGKVIPDKWTKFKIKVIWGSSNNLENNNEALGLWRDGKLYHQEWGKHNFYNNVTPFGERLGPYIMVGAYTPLFTDEHEPIVVKIRELTVKRALYNIQRLNKTP